MNRTAPGKQSPLTHHSSEEDIEKHINLVRAGHLPKNSLVALLSERHPVYHDRPIYQATRIKAYTMASFAMVGLPDAALNFILDELQNGKKAYLVAAAARALRGAKSPDPRHVSFLLQALDNIRYHDDSISLNEFRPSWPLAQPTTAKKEILLTFQWLQGYAQAAIPELQSLLNNNYDFDLATREEIQKTIHTIKSDDRELDLTCCEFDGRSTAGLSWLWRGIRNIKSIAHLEVENDRGLRHSLSEFIGQSPTVIAFFYTRCMNPNKCTLTINKLGWLQQELQKTGLQDKVNILAFTYDPAYDTPTRMNAFGRNRGMVFNPNVHMLRTSLADFSLLSNFFRLGVSQVGATITQHRIELFLLSPNGNVSTSYTQLRWEVEKVHADLQRMLKSTPRSGWLAVTNSVQQVVFPVLLAFFPKCPMCWAVYLSAFGVSGLRSIPYSPWLIPWLMLAIAINLFMLYRKARARNGLTPFWFSLAGGILVIGPGYMLSYTAASMFGITLLLSGALLNSLPYRQFIKLQHALISAFTLLKKRTIRSADTITYP